MKKNGGPAKARNQGIQEAEGNIIAFTDDDCVVHRDWIVNLLSSLDSDDNIVGVGGRVLALDDSLISLYNTVHRILEPPRSRKYLVSANCCYLREPVVQVEGFDMDIAKPGGEDIGLSFKLYKRGHRFAFARKAIVYHDYRNDIVDFVRTFTNYGEGCRYVTEKYFANGGRLD
jgi:GT2 family glycosyltransferase